MSRSLELDVITAQMKLVNDCLGEWKAQVLFVCLRLGVFESLRDVPKGLAQLAQESSLPQDSLGRLLLGAVSAGFLALDEQQRFDLPTACRLVLLRGQAGYLGNYLELMSRWYDSFGKLEQAVRQDGAVEDPNHGGDPDYQETFVRGMTDYASYRGADLLNHLDLGDRRRLLDVGGGPGAYCCLLAEAYPELQCTNFDLAPALQVAARQIAERGLIGRIELCPGDWPAPQN